MKTKFLFKISCLFIICLFLQFNSSLSQCDYPVEFTGNDCADLNGDGCSNWTIEQKEVPVSVQVHFPPDPPEIVICTLKVCYAYRICADGVRQVDILYVSFINSTNFSIVVRDCYFLWNHLMNLNNGNTAGAIRDLYNIAHENLCIMFFEEELAYAIAHGVEAQLQCPNGIKSYEWWDGSCISFCSWEEELHGGWIPEGDVIFRYHHLKRACQNDYCCARIFDICWEWIGNERVLVVTPAHVSSQEECENKPDPWGNDCLPPKEKTDCIERCP